MQGNCTVFLTFYVYFLSFPLLINGLKWFNILSFYLVWFGWVGVWSPPSHYVCVKLGEGVTREGQQGKAREGRTNGMRGAVRGRVSSYGKRLKNLQQRDKNRPPTLKKIFVFLRGTVAPYLYITQTLYTSHIFLYLC